MKTIIVERNDFDIDSFTDKILDWLNKECKDLPPDSAGPHILNADELDVYEEKKKYIKKDKKDYFSQLEKSESLFFPFTLPPDYCFLGDDKDLLNGSVQGTLKSIDETNYPGSYISGEMGPAAFQWGNDEDDPDTFLEFSEAIGFIISLKKSRYFIKSGMLRCVGDIQHHIKYFTDEKKYELFNKPMEKFIESFIAKKNTKSKGR